MSRAWNARVAAGRAARRHEANARAQVDQLRAWEQRLTPDEMQRATEFVRAQGWVHGSEPPPFVWQAAYQHVALGKRP